MPPDPLESPERPPSRTTKLHPLWVAGIVTAGVTALSYAAPVDYAATVVGGAFILAVVWLVLRHDVTVIRHYALSLAGVLEPSPIEWGRLGREAARAAGWAFGLMIVIVGPFLIGFKIYWHVRHPFSFRLPASISDEVLGQMLVIALPEEAFYRGYLMTALDDAWGTPWTIAKAKLGWGWIASSALFAVGHLLTEPNPERLAVFFPALVFGWLRARTGGIGAPAVFHALCNVLASTLARGYGMAP